MADDLEKRLEKAEKHVSKGKIEPAIEEYKAALKLAPQRLELLHTLGDLCQRVDRSGEALAYYGELFDKYSDRGDTTKALSVFRKSLHGTEQPPERNFKLGNLLQRSQKNEEAAEAFRNALDGFRRLGNSQGAVECLDRIGSLEPDHAETQIQLGEQATRLGRAEMAAKAFLRAGRLLLAENPDRALELLERSRELAPGDRTVVLYLAQALIGKGQTQQAVEMLQPLAGESERDPAVLSSLGEALLAANLLDEATPILETLSSLQPDGYDKMFQLADRYLKENEPEKGVDLLRRLKDRLFEARRQREFLERLESLLEQNQSLIPLAEFSARVFNETNQEGRYGATLGRLFHLYGQAKQHSRAMDVLERLVDLDPYDLLHQKRLEQVKGKVDESRFRALSNRLLGAPPFTGPAAKTVRGDEKAEAVPAASRQSVLEDMIVQVEIFLQYSLKAKAIEKLQRVHELFPGEESRNERLYKLYEMAQYFPPGFGGPPLAGPPAAAPEAAPAAPPPPPAPPPAEPPPAPVLTPTVAATKDLAKISEISHGLFREGTTKMILHRAVSEVAKYLHVSRCLGSLGRPLTSPTTAVEFCAPGVQRSSGARVAKLLEFLSQTKLDPENGLALEADHSELQALGEQSLLAMPILDKENQELTGVLVLSQSDRSRRWKTNEVYLLKAVADQVEIAVGHLKLRSLMKTLSVADEGTGLLGRTSYLDALTSEVARAKAQGTPLVVTLLELDKGTQLLRKVGEEPIQRFMQQAGETLLAQMRPNDIAFRYTTTALAWVLMDTTADKVRMVVERLRKQLNTMKLAGVRDGLSFSAGISEAAIRPDYDPLDIVTDVINRAEFSLEDARRKGNALVVR